MADRAPPLLLLAALACNGEEPATSLDDALPWSDCGDGFRCASFPSDDAEVSVVWHPGEVEPETVAVLAQGGPGSSSIDLLRLLVTSWADDDPVLWGDRSWIAVDNRGVGSTDPVTCVGDDWFDDLRAYAPASPDDAADLGALRDAFQAGCLADRDAPALVALGTGTYIDDLDTLRRILGVETIDFLGFSYGTHVGATYAARYPERVGRFVLDGVVGPETTRDVFLAGQAAGFEAALERFFARCADDATCAIHADPAGTFDGLLAAAAVAPLAAPSDPDGRVVTRNDLRWAAATALYGPDDASLAASLAAADAGDAASLLALADAGWGRDDGGAYDPSLQRYWAIGCLDVPWPDGWTDGDVTALGAELDLASPRLGSMLLTGELTCLGWPATAEPPALAAPTAPPLLLVAGERDPATPFASAEATRDALGNDSALLSFGGDGHVAMFVDGSGCAYDAERAYLAYGELPAGDCP